MSESLQLSCSEPVRLCSVLVTPCHPCHACHASAGSALWDCRDLEVPEEKEAAPERPSRLSVGKVAVPGVRSPGICFYVELALGRVLTE